MVLVQLHWIWAIHNISGQLSERCKGVWSALMLSDDNMWPILANPTNLWFWSDDVDLVEVFLLGKGPNISRSLSYLDFDEMILDLIWLEVWYIPAFKTWHWFCLTDWHLLHSCEGTEYGFTQVWRRWFWTTNLTLSDKNSTLDLVDGRTILTDIYEPELVMIWSLNDGRMILSFNLRAEPYDYISWSTRQSLTCFWVSDVLHLFALDTGPDHIHIYSAFCTILMLRRWDELFLQRHWTWTLGALIALLCRLIHCIYCWI